jgi:hypothetical protein
MRLLKLKTPALALVLSIVGEVVLALCLFIFGQYGAFGPANVVTALIVYFHRFADALASYLVPHDTSFLTAAFSVAIIVAVGLVQWFAIFFLSISAYRRFCRKAI